MWYAVFLQRVCLLVLDLLYVNKGRTLRILFYVAFLIATVCPVFDHFDQKLDDTVFTTEKIVLLSLHVADVSLCTFFVLI